MSVFALTKSRRTKLRAFLSSPYPERKKVSSEVKLAAYGLGGLSLGIIALASWPYLGLATAIIIPSVSIFLGLVIKSPKNGLRRTKPMFGITIIILASTGILQAYDPNLGGSVGRWIGGTNPVFSIIRSLVIILIVLSLMAPGKRREAIQYLRKLSGFCRPYLLALTKSIGAFLLFKVLALGKLSFRLGMQALKRSPMIPKTLLKVYRLYPLHSMIILGISKLLTTLTAILSRFFKKPNASGQQSPIPFHESPLIEQKKPRFEEEPKMLDNSPDDSDSTSQFPIEKTSHLGDHPAAEWAPPSTRTRKTDSGWALPSLDLLKTSKEVSTPDEENQMKARLIETTLADYGIEVKVESIRPGPVVTQFGLTPGWSRRIKDVQERDSEGLPIRDDRGRLVKRSVEDKTRVKVDSILSREKDLALALAASSIRMEAPVPGEPLVGIEVPNARPSIVSLKSMIEDEAFTKLREKGGIPIVFGRSSGGEPVIADLVNMPHLLIAGATGSGKSVCINTIVCSLLMQFSPIDLRLILIDPKRVELTPYRGLPHLLSPVMVEAEDAVPALRNLISEMKARYSLFERAGVRDIESYNRKAGSSNEALPFIVLIIDELADLMMASPHEVEQGLCRLAQLCRATGIHLIVATQRPSVDVITGLIKANIPSRISFAVSSQVDSRTILDGAGAEKLLGRGDMLFLPTNLPKPKRLQGAFISDEEVEKLTNHWKKANNPANLPEMALQMIPPSQPIEAHDSLLTQAQELAQEYRRLSASLLQRKLGVGYIKASSLIDQLEELGILDSGAPGKSRNVLIN